jgi:hypothetical protein
MLRTGRRLALAGLCTALPLAAQTGGIAGTVADPAGRALPGATVGLAGSRIVASTDTGGSFSVSGLAPGTTTLEVSYLGYESRRLDVAVEAGAVPRVAIELEPASSVHETVIVSAEPILEGQAKALNQQRVAANIKSIVAADQIGSFPDTNAAEATQRLPGATLQRDQGEGRYVIIRGTDPRLSSALINGERVPSPEGEVRYVALDVVPADLLEAIEVSNRSRPTWTVTRSVERST